MKGISRDYEVAEEKAINGWWPVRYIGLSCPKCGRQRVEQCANGQLKCEKCEWVLEESRYLTECIVELTREEICSRLNAVGWRDCKNWRPIIDQPGDEGFQAEWIEAHDCYGNDVGMHVADAAGIIAGIDASKQRDKYRDVLIHLYSISTDTIRQVISDLFCNSTDGEGERQAEEMTK